MDGPVIRGMAMGGGSVEAVGEVVQDTAMQFVVADHRLEELVHLLGTVNVPFAIVLHIQVARTARLLQVF